MANHHYLPWGQARAPHTPWDSGQGHVQPRTCPQGHLESTGCWSGVSWLPDLAAQGGCLGNPVKLPSVCLHQIWRGVPVCGQGWIALKVLVPSSEINPRAKIH